MFVHQFCIADFPLLSILFSTSHCILSLANPAGHEALSQLEVRQFPGVVPVQNFLRRAYHTSAVAGRYLYIEGGELAFRNEIDTVYQYSSSTLSIDLSQDWTNSTVVLQATNKPSGTPQLSFPSLWWDERNGLFYSGVTGRTSYFDAPATPSLSLWSFKPDNTGSGTWAEVIPTGDAAWKNLTRTTYGYQASDGSTALVLGGVTTTKTSPKTENISQDTLQPGILEFDMTNRRFSNLSATDFNANATGVAGQMQFVPSFGPNGLFVILGGNNNTDNQYGFDNITFYDAATHRFYNQTTTGNVPRGREQFCIAGVSSVDESYEIFLYGGGNGHLGPEAVSYDEIYILTLPAFYWMRVNYVPRSPRGGHTCNAVGGSQIFSIGGFDENSTLYFGQYDDIRESIFNSTADPFAQGLGIFDMTSLKWEDHYTANAQAYIQSDLIKTFYTQNPQDGSQFLESQLKELFRTTHFTPLASPDENNTNTPSTSDPSSGSENTGSIAGGVTGGVVGLAAIVGIAFHFYRRKKRRNVNDGTTASRSSLEPTVHPLVEADQGATLRGWQLEGQGIQEMQHHPTEMPTHHNEHVRHDHIRHARYELEAAQQRG